MTSQMKANLLELSKKYVEKQVQTLGTSVKKQDVSRAIKKVNQALVEIESARQGLKK
jgi:hypothetical protein